MSERREREPEREVAYAPAHDDHLLVERTYRVHRAVLVRPGQHLLVEGRRGHVLDVAEDLIRRRGAGEGHRRSSGERRVCREGKGLEEHQRRVQVRSRDCTAPPMCVAVRKPYL